MPTFKIHVINSDFRVCNEIEAHDLNEARDQGLKGALAIGAEELRKGETAFFGAEVCVEVQGEAMHRFLVSMGQSPLR